MDTALYDSRHFLILIDCSPSRLVVWWPLHQQDCQCIQYQRQSICIMSYLKTSSHFPQHWITHFVGTTSEYGALILHPLLNHIIPEDHTVWGGTLFGLKLHIRGVWPNLGWAIWPRLIVCCQYIDGIPLHVKDPCLFMRSNPSSGHDSDSEESELVNLRSSSLV